MLATGELVVLYREEDMPNAPARVSLSALAGRPLVSLASSGPIGQLLTSEAQRVGIEFDEIVLARTFHIAAALVRQGVGMTVVDNLTAVASLAPGLAMRPLEPRLTFDIYAFYLQNRPPTAMATDFLKALAARLTAIAHLPVSA